MFHRLRRHLLDVALVFSHFFSLVFDRERSSLNLFLLIPSHSQKLPSFRSRLIVWMWNFLHTLIGFKVWMISPFNFFCGKSHWQGGYIYLLIGGILWAGVFLCTNLIFSFSHFDSVKVHMENMQIWKTPKINNSLTCVNVRFMKKKSNWRLFFFFCG